VKEVYVKRSGAWVKAYEYDVTPPNPPEISLGLVKTTYTANGKQQTGRHIKVGVRGSAVSHDPTLKRIRVLTTYAGKAPTTYAGGTYHSTPDKQWPDEPWSEYYYNGYLGAPSSLKNSSSYVEREFPVNATNKTVVEPGVYYFTAWSEDINGNWSVGTAASITVPKNLQADRDFGDVERDLQLVGGHRHHDDSREPRHEGPRTVRKPTQRRGRPARNSHHPKCADLRHPRQRRWRGSGKRPCLLVQSGVRRWHRWNAPDEWHDEAGEHR
jgi:hypothetical protein